MCLTEVEEEHVYSLASVELVVILLLLIRVDSVEQVLWVGPWNEDVGGIDIEVNHVLRVDELQSQQQLLGDVGDLLGR